MGDQEHTELAAVIDEIQREAHRLRAGGEIPGDIEASLDGEFLNTVAGLRGRTAGSDVAHTVESEEIGPPLPTPSVRNITGRLRTLVKRWSYRVTLWQMDDLTTQINRQLAIRDESIRSLMHRVATLEGDLAPPPESDGSDRPPR